MKKNKMMRTAAVLGVAALLTTSALSGTLAKYTTKVESGDAARVAAWGFTESSINLTGLFTSSYKTGESENVKSITSTPAGSQEDVIAPGTTNKETFDFTYGGEQAAPEVAYTFSVSTEGSNIDTFIKANKNILWRLDGKDDSTNEWKSWDDFIKEIKKLSGDDSGTKTYKPGELPTGFNSKAANTHTVEWKWDFNENNSETSSYWVKGNAVTTTEPTSEKETYTAMTQDEYDTYMGNMTELDDVNLKITITATQID